MCGTNCGRTWGVFPNCHDEILGERLQNFVPILYHRPDFEAFGDFFYLLESVSCRFQKTVKFTWFELRRQTATAFLSSSTRTIFADQTDLQVGSQSIMIEDFSK